MAYNKKGAGQFLTVIIALPILLLMALLGTIGFYEIGQEYVISDISNITQEYVIDNNLSTTYQTLISEGETNFNSVSFPYDIMFAIIVLTAWGATALAALKADRIPTLSFLGMVTFGIMMMLVIIFFVSQFVDWYLQDFFYLIFDDLTVQTPLLTWFFAHLNIVSLIWFASLLLLNQIEVDFRELFKKREGGVTGADSTIDQGRIQP